ncbi:hypothetical protein BS78_07G087800 [Paspalum vaginatum]|nr:hypothetical protein BS78_07G087800 [Paspalum vaginatum]
MVAGSMKHPRAAPASVSTAGAAAACAARGLGSGDGWRSGHAEKLLVGGILVFSSFLLFWQWDPTTTSFLGRREYKVFARYHLISLPSSVHVNRLQSSRVPTIRLGVPTYLRSIHLVPNVHMIIQEVKNNQPDSVKIVDFQILQKHLSSPGILAASSNISCEEGTMN